MSYRLTTDKRKVCPDCGGEEFVTHQSAGDVVCKSCGLVVEAHIIDERSEWRTFGDTDKDTEDPNRVGGPSNTMLADGGLSTTIGRLQGDGGASSTLQRYHQRQGGSDRGLSAAQRAINGVCDRLSLVDAIKWGAVQIFQQVHDTRAVKGRGLQSVYAACIFIACRRQSMPRTFKEICAVVPDANRKDIGRAFTEIHKMLQAEKQAELAAGDAAAGDAAAAGGGGGGAPAAGGVRATGPMAGGAAASPADVMRRFSSRLGFAKREAAAAVRIAETAMAMAEHSLVPWSGRNPNTVASSILYLVNEIHKVQGAPAAEVRTLAEVASRTGSAPTTIKDSVRDMMPYLDQLVPESFATKAQLAQVASGAFDMRRAPLQFAASKPNLVAAAAATAAAPKAPPAVAAAPSRSAATPVAAAAAAMAPPPPAPAAGAAPRPHGATAATAIVID